MFYNKVYPQQIETHTQAHAQAHAHTQSDAEAYAQAHVNASYIENEFEQLECINSDYGYAQSYFYVFMFICLITGIIIFG